MRTKRIVATLLLLQTMGCGGYFAPDRNVREKLSSQDVIGAWKLTEESLVTLEKDGLVRQKDHQYTVVFERDGNCTFESVIDFSRPVYLRSPECKWALLHDDEFANAPNAIEMNVAQGGVWFIRFARESGELILWSFHGDPDLWEFIEYKRMDETAA